MVTNHPGAPVPFYFKLAREERPPVAKTGDAETYLLKMIQNGQVLVSTWHALGHTYADQSEPPARLPEWNEPETYYDVLTDILATADDAGFDARELCNRAITHQRAFKEEAQDMANQLRGDK